MHFISRAFSPLVKNFSQQVGKTQSCCARFQKNFAAGKMSYSQFNAAKNHLMKHKQMFQPGCRVHAIKSKLNVGWVAPEIPLKAQKIVGGWLLTCAGMVVGAISIGGLTRLTESGLSMVDWKLFKDMKPPRSQQEWEEEFERYKSYPEYKYVNKEREMTVSDFKFIYYMEYIHRMWGRGVGLVFLIPAAVFLSKGWISKAMKPRLAMFTALIGFQGFLGWYMVKSGLQDQPESTHVPRVSQYRLAAHLGSALLLYTMFLWDGLTHLLRPQTVKSFKKLTFARNWATAVMCMVFLTALSGAFVAGQDAGLIYNTWPRMGDKYIPDDLTVMTPKWKNMFENATTAQFNHRHLAELTGVVALAFSFYASEKYPLPKRAHVACGFLTGAVLIQIGLGISTLLTHVPTSLAALHQSGSVGVLSVATWIVHELRRIPK